MSSKFGILLSLFTISGKHEELNIIYKLHFFKISPSKTGAINRFSDFKNTFFYLNGHIFLLKEDNKPLSGIRNSIERVKVKETRPVLSKFQPSGQGVFS